MLRTTSRSTHDIVVARVPMLLSCHAVVTVLPDCSTVPADRPSPVTTSALSHLIRWIESFQFHAGVGGGEPPVDFREGLVSLFFPSGDLLRQERLAFKASVQALTREDTQLRLRHVQPTAVFGRVVDLKPRRQGEG